ncbi:histidine phosphatase family protein [Corynebacterium sp. TAE3-ERU12]|uniref:histidine phosphatase family protein n=1 Tax=Corynebacterium sp. TAE3-ERU12 TaxID=2849491 RepID=UPI001C4427FD|nr:histidine phosphatase family protein [Corynebacterium sp. TAE3-ERU12]MBV7295809.1 histidine phosphatase family protein [Corynebacterium sp. TAE3-ERU12]
MSWAGLDSQPARLVLLRHGQTPMSVDRRYSGSRSDVALTDLGTQQAQRAAADLARSGWDFAGIVCSPLLRTRQTAEFAAEALGLSLEIDDDLRELDFGDWEGMTFAEARERDPEQHAAWMADPEHTTPGGESFAALDARVRAARERICERYAGRDVLVVSHVSPIKATLRQAMGSGYEVFTRMFLDLASVSVAEFYPEGRTSVTLVNSTAHLR